MKSSLNSSFKGKVGGAIAHDSMHLVKDRLDYSQYGGVPLLGVKGGISIVCHEGQHRNCHLSCYPG